MPKYLSTLLLILFSSLTFSQDGKSNNKIIDDFIEDANTNILFGNGISITINRPDNDTAALKRGFSSCQCDSERQGNWTYLLGKNVLIHNILHRAILYEHNGKMNIALTSERENEKYYFRIYCDVTSKAKH